jgi:uncharacterized protein involved in exopolysaccharide biosynthesis
MEQQQEGKSLLDIVEALFRNRGLVVLTAGIVMVACLAYAVLAKPQYGSTMRILVQNTRSNTIVGAESGASVPGAMTSDMMESKINSEVELLQSSDLLESLVRYRDTQLLGKPVPAEGSVEMGLQIQAVQRNLEVTPLRKTNVIQISFIDSNPVNAQKSLEWLSSEFLNKHVALQRPGATYQFFDGQVQLAQTQLQDAQSKLLAYDETTGVTAPEQERQLTQQRLSENSSDAQQAKATLQADQARLAQIREQKASTPPRLKTEIKSGANAGSTQQLDTILAELQNKRIQLLTRFKPDDRLVKEVDAQIASTQASLAGINSKESAQTTEDVNPVMTMINEDIEKTSADILAQQARLSALTQTSASYEARLQQLQGVGVQRDVLDRKVQELTDNLKKYTSKRDDFQVDAELDKIKIIDVAVAQTPTLSSMPVRPHRKLIVALGAVLACFLSVGILFAKEALRETMYTPHELEAVASSPVLATLPEIPLTGPALSALEARAGTSPLEEARPAAAGIRRLR